MENWIFVQSAPSNEISKSVLVIDKPAPCARVNDNWDPVTE